MAEEAKLNTAGHHGEIEAGADQKVDQQLAPDQAVSSGNDAVEPGGDGVHVKAFHW